MCERKNLDDDEDEQTGESLCSINLESSKIGSLLDIKEMNDD